MMTILSFAHKIQIETASITQGSSMQSMNNGFESVASLLVRDLMRKDPGYIRLRGRVVFVDDSAHAVFPEGKTFGADTMG